MNQRLRGALIDRVGRIGKRVLIWTGCRQALVFEPRMTGLLLVNDPPDRGHLRLEVQIDGPPGCFWFWDRRGLGTVRLLTVEQVAERLGPARLGPDALQLTASELKLRLAHRRAAVKVALMNQSAIAGIGNLYASEILHVARIHPERACDALTSGQWTRLADSMQTVLRIAIRYEGSTLGDGTYRTALNRPGRFQNRHRVYGREGQPCPTCGRGRVRKIVQAQRSTFFCARCQRR